MRKLSSNPPGSTPTQAVREFVTCHLKGADKVAIIWEKDEHVGMIHNDLTYRDLMFIIKAADACLIDDFMNGGPGK